MMKTTHKLSYTSKLSDIIMKSSMFLPYNEYYSIIVVVLYTVHVMCTLKRWLNDFFTVT